MTKTFQSYCENELAILSAQFQSSRIVAHAVTAGGIREELIKDFLKRHLPELVTITAGQIVDANGSYSRQQDVVLVLKSMPRMPFSSDVDLIFQEGVVGIMEIKTTLNASIIADIGKNIKSVKTLVSNVGASGQMGVTHNWPANKVLSCILTYGSNSWESLMPGLKSLDELSTPDMVLDLSKGLLIRNNGLLLPVEGEAKFILVDNAARGFMFFITFLTEITGTLSSRGVLWRKYW